MRKKRVFTDLPRRIGVIHLPPLPGSPGTSALSPGEALQLAGAQAVREAKILVKFGFDGIIIENFGDVPFYKNKVPPETIAAMSIIAAAVRSVTRVKIGINVLRNDASAALAVAAVTGADFIRVNVLSGVSATDQGLIEGHAAELIREKIRLNASHIKILADIHVKHARSLSSTNPLLSIEETAGRGGADGVIITGDTTGRLPELNDIQNAIESTHQLGIPLYIGSGLQPANLAKIPTQVGMIIGSTLRENGKAGAPLDPKRIRLFFASLSPKRKVRRRVQARKPTP